MGIIQKPARSEFFLSSTPYLVIRKMTAANPPASAGATNQAAIIAETPLASFQVHWTPSLPMVAMATPIIAPTME